jgi:hypothetical protein
MTRHRSISYAPQSPRSGRVPSTSNPRAEWTLCRQSVEFPVADDAMLRHWTEQGRVRGDDYLVHGRLDMCVQASEVAELDAIFRKARSRRLERIARTLACAAIATLWFVPLIGTVILLAAVGTAVVSRWTVRHHQTYRLSTADAARAGVS